MKSRQQLGMAGVAGMVAVLVAGCTIAWKSTGIGISVPEAALEWDAKTLTLTGTGAGVDVKGGDQCHFVSVPREGGDFEIVARLVDLSGSSNAAAGLMARAGDGTNDAMAALYFSSQGSWLSWRSRSPASAANEGPRTFSGGIQLVEPPPLWIRMVRMGRNFAVYKSRDGKLWSMISNVSGGPVAFDGPVQIGFFVASGSEGKMGTAIFDSIAIGPPRMRYRTSWVGNTFGSRDEDKHISNALSAMWVAPDGTCFTSSYWDEGGRPVTSYRDGKVARALPIGTPQTAEGGIAGDGRCLYVAAVDKITVLDPAAPDFAPQPLSLSVNLLDKKTGNCVVSGLAANGREVFVADSRDNLIRIAALAPIPLHCRPLAANFGVKTAPALVVVPEREHEPETGPLLEGDTPQATVSAQPRFAPAVVYQTQRVGEGVEYRIPGLVPQADYKVRCHMATYTDKHPAMSTGRENERLDILKLAGGVLKPCVKDFTGYKADTNGMIRFAFGGYGGAMCGLEVLDAAGKRVFAVNCGGPAVLDFLGESQELASRAFAFERPGPMAFDKRGDLWIIQRGNDFPIGGGTSAKYPAAVKCYGTNGLFSGRQITDVVNPRALGYDAAKDQLLVAENGPDLNVRFYGGLNDKPALARTFGEKGGLYAGRNPGLVNDPAAGGYARFAGISGVGVDAQGNLYVGGGFQGTDLRMFTPDGRLGWMLNSLMFCNTYDIDPDSDGTELYGTYTHLSLDLSKTASGAEQRYVGYNWDLRRFGEPVRAGSSQAIVRRLGPDRRLVMFTSGQGQIGDIHIFRYEGDLTIPAGGTRDQGKVLWTDTNGDAKEDPDERFTMASPIGWITGLCVDSKGDIRAAVTTTGGSFMRHFAFKGFNNKGVPLYSGVQDEGYVDVRFPEEGDKTNGWGMASRLDYDADRDIMIAFYPAAARKGDKDLSAPYFLARYDNWSKGNRTPVWKQRAPSQETQPDYFMYEVGKPYNCVGYMGLQMAGDYVFMAHLWGEIHVFDLGTGALVEILSAGPEVNGQNAWEDAAMGLRAFKRQNGEYLIFTENSGWGGKNNFFRWTPSK
jgi:Ni/Co efflux regulator RcnB